MGVKERLKAFISSVGMGQKAFEIECGLSNGYVNNIRRSITVEKARQILEHFPNLNMGWLMTGEGEMLKGSASHAVYTGNVTGNGNNFVAGNNNNIGTPSKEDAETIESEDVEIKETVILMPEIVNKEGIDIKKGIKEGTLDAEIKPTQDVLPPHHAKVYTENDEMSPEIEANDPVFVRLLTSKNDFLNGRMYFVNLENGCVVRWVVRVDAEHIRLISMKDEETVSMSSVKSISEVVAITKRPKTLPKERVTFDEAIARKDNQLDAMIEHQSKFLEQQSELIGIIKEQLKGE